MTAEKVATLHKLNYKFSGTCGSGITFML